MEFEWAQGERIRGNEEKERSDDIVPRACMYKRGKEERVMTVC